MKINIQALNRGLNNFEFDADLNELSLTGDHYTLKTVAVKSVVDKGDQNIIVSSDVRTTVALTCDSCLDGFTDVLREQYTLVYTSEQEALDDDETVRLIGRGSQTINLAEGLRECILLSLPLRFKCAADCQGLCDQCGTNLNKESCQCRKETMDLRWQGLKDLFSESQQ